MQGLLAVGPAMGLVKAADNTNQSKVGTMQYLVICSCPVFVGNLQKHFASHIDNNDQLLALGLPDLGKTPHLKLRQSVNGGLCPSKALTPDEFMTPLCLLYLQQSTPGLQKLSTFDPAHCIFFSKYFCCIFLKSFFFVPMKFLGFSCLAWLGW